MFLLWFVLEKHFQSWPESSWSSARFPTSCQPGLCLSWPFLKVFRRIFFSQWIHPPQYFPLQKNANLFPIFGFFYFPHSLTCFLTILLYSRPFQAIGSLQDCYFAEVLLFLLDWTFIIINLNLFNNQTSLSSLSSSSRIYLLGYSFISKDLRFIKNLIELGSFFFSTSWS